MRTLYVAAGGGGDAVGALLARRALGDTDERPPLVTTCAWERLRIDPVPGPRARTDFTGLGLVGGEPCEVLPTSDTTPSGRSVLPRLAETSGARIFLHDFEDGAVGLAEQLQRLAGALAVERLVVVDVGGDVVARGSEPSLRSPLADSLTLAGALGVGIETSVVVLGPGADAELPANEVISLLQQLGGEEVGRVSPVDVRDLASVLHWHPTESTALVASSARGVRGYLVMRRGRRPVPITSQSSVVWEIRPTGREMFPLAHLMRETMNLSDSEEIMRAAAVNEIDFERSVAGSTGEGALGMSLASVVHELMESGATHITARRLSESLSRQSSQELDEVLEGLSLGLLSVDDLRKYAGRA